MAIGFAASGPAIYGSAYYTVRAANDPPGTTRGARALALGQDAYEDGSDPSRWGDYSGIALDPSDQVTFWIYNEYAQARSNGTTSIPDDQGRYGTRWGAFHLAALPPPTGGGGGATTSAFVTGVKWSDTDKDGVFDSTEKGVAGFTMYVDLNSNDKS